MNEYTIQIRQHGKWADVAFVDDTETAWDLYISASATPARVRLIKNGTVISTSHIEDAV